MVTRQTNVNAVTGVIAWLAAGLFFAGAPTQGHAQSKAAAPTTLNADKHGDEPASRSLKIAMRQWKGQMNVLVACEWPQYDFLCVADRADFDEAESTLRLSGNALVEVKDKPKLYTGKCIVVDFKKKTVDVLEPRTQDRVAPAEPAPKSSEAAKVEKLWADYKVEFLIRVSPRMDVLTVKECDFNDSNGGSPHTVLSQKCLFGKHADDRKPGDVVYLYPATDATKVFLVNYLGQESRNWFPYDESLEKKILTVMKPPNAASASSTE
ncbi:MAG TPA: hypothetical protein VGP76_11470 [Planctomycetaceae bacterium]|jgi:hypothetical protein|nr:hypothetical protein [Planctomycetaceae bacterium]